MKKQIIIGIIIGIILVGLVSLSNFNKSDCENSCKEECSLQNKTIEKCNEDECICMDYPQIPSNSCGTENGRQIIC